MPRSTSWENVADWYDKLLGEGGGEGTYQKELILPNLLRLMDIKRGDRVVDIACGPGFFTREFANLTSHVIGVDASPALIAKAKANAGGGVQADGKGGEVTWRVAQADKLTFLDAASADKAAIVLALQNIENMTAVLKECARVLKVGGELYLVLNHPAFRIPKESSWGWDEAAKVQYRRVDRYLSELKAEIAMNPGRSSGGAHTVSFHRPLQSYFKAFAKAGLGVVAMEEWNSHKKSEAGPRAIAEDRARKEMPLFACLVCRKI